MKIRILAILFIMILAISFVFAAEDESLKLKQRIKADVEAINNALLTQDYGKIVDLTYPPIVKLMGGREKMIAAMQKGTKELQAAGMAFLSAKVDDPSDPVKGGDDLFVVITYELEMRIPEGKGRQKTCMIGISSDQGKTWTYIGWGKDPAFLKKLVPNFPDNLKIPEATEPVVEKTPPATAPAKK